LPEWELVTGWVARPCGALCPRVLWALAWQAIPRTWAHGLRHAGSPSVVPAGSSQATTRARRGKLPVRRSSRRPSIRANSCEGHSVRSIAWSASSFRRAGPATPHAYERAGVGTELDPGHRAHVRDESGYASSSSYSVFSFATTAGSASVVVSPSFLPSAMSRSSRRMIFPERVFGKSAVNRI
jgi:hypothetical protein